MKVLLFQIVIAMAVFASISAVESAIESRDLSISMEMAASSVEKQASVNNDFSLPHVADGYKISRHQEGEKPHLDLADGTFRLRPAHMEDGNNHQLADEELSKRRTLLHTAGVVSVEESESLAIHSGDSDGEPQTHNEYGHPSRDPRPRPPVNDSEEKEDDDISPPNRPPRKEEKEEEDQEQDGDGGDQQLPPPPQEPDESNEEPEKDPQDETDPDTPNADEEGTHDTGRRHDFVDSKHLTDDDSEPLWFPWSPVLIFIGGAFALWGVIAAFGAAVYFLHRACVMKENQEQAVLQYDDIESASSSRYVHPSTRHHFDKLHESDEAV